MQERGNKVPLLHLKVAAGTVDPLGGGQQALAVAGAPPEVAGSPDSVISAYYEERSKRVLYADLDLHLAVGLSLSQAAS